MLQIIPALIAFFTGLLAIPVVIKIIKKTNLLDEPGGRKIHKEAVPSMGGIGIVCAILGGLMVAFSYQQWLEVRFLMMGLGVMFLLGLRDDMVELSALQKLFGQLLAIAFVVVLGDIRISSFYGFLGVEELPIWMSYGLTVFTIIGLTNAFNLVDGLDGLAGTLSLISFLFLGGWFLSTGFVEFGVMSLVTAGGILSFMVYNWHPAKIFMGDTGSLTLGFMLSVFSVFFVNANGTLLADGHPLKFHAPITAGLALVLISCFDTLRVMVKRMKRGKSPMAADKSHVHHFLMRMGLRHDQVTCLLGGVKLSFLGLVVATSGFSDSVLLPFVLGTVVVLCLTLDAVTLRKVRKIAKNSPRILTLDSPNSFKDRQVENSKKVLEREIMQ
ncbi:undecaprenyl/decaprenyl-phosphate alpha-N-acetylglucosaminyl 1-phosphate transferase [Echinicola sp. CAU 1574]|uniref:Undecaprenyl/decaprenyl-phosphate alpha-N-acetylglucosaminyl 1-phosphate transferase n=1 Tax=Echinicola arenosa TaxID=2774144 RepID=A0ABR9AFP8_9BACT|nr:MraY family glycosyltransferase [Echinicola arenosa]MBD8487538.1 undecaprenyl/decaprenyl-phosphate alpha-N-acetylglucosaminyl 1-phosphate transferase [Echinicola arenosa]